jgi:surface protein
MTLEWSHIAVRSDGQRTTLYFNGDSVASGNFVESCWNQIELGRNRNRDNPGNYKVDNVTIWNRALTTYEIYTVRNNMIHDNDDDLLIWWNMETGSGQTLYDNSGNNHDATLHGATWDEDVPLNTFQPQTQGELQTAVDLWTSDSASALAAYGEINTWDVSLITDMSSIFNSKDLFNSDISNWNVSNVSNMHRMFYAAEVFNRDISDWDVSNVTQTNDMFMWANNFNQDLSSWNMSNVTNMNGMFKGAISFNAPDTFQLDMSALKDIAPLNIPFILVTFDMFQLDKS